MKIILVLKMNALKNHSILPTLLFLLLFTVISSSCRTSRKGFKSNSTKPLSKLIDESIILNGTTGFVVADIKTNEFLFEKSADTYFTPASNTKILTLYTALNVFGDSMPTLRFSHSNSQVIIQGTGHPSFLNPDFPTERDDVFSFLKEQKEPITFCDCNFQEEKYGSGWSWDDYYYSFQSEKSSLPVYGNVATFIKKKKDKPAKIHPKYFENQTTSVIDSFTERTSISRSWDSNQFTINQKPNNTFTKRKRPFRADAITIAQLLSDTLTKNIQTCNNRCTKQSFNEFYSNISAKDIYKEMMLNSNNFVAEQLLLLCANQLFDTLTITRSIDWAQDSLFYFLKQQPKWVDGSGLSRYNMMTPKSMVQVLQQLYKKMEPAQAFELFPAGGKTGTLENWFTDYKQPFVFAKTGSMRHIFCLSGYLTTESGKTLAFSFMQNNYVGSTKNLKKEIEKILQHIHETF
ncbi:MAG: D-alanyl-D-alanine carboxypeptidase/D-alanyl-D-alanine-endopeptidase [Saprospiraceae bacterium]